MSSRTTTVLPGLFLAFEGLDGSGKTTQIDLLERHLIRRGYDVVVTRAPGGCYVSEELRRVFLDCHRMMHPVTEVSVLLSAINESFHTVVKPALKEGRIVIADRWTGSTRAYQGGGKGHGDALVTRLMQSILAGVTHPSSTFYVHTSVGTAQSRLAQRSQKDLSSMDKEKEEFFERVLKTYDAIYSPDETFDGEGTPEEIHECVVRSTNAALHRWEKTHTLARKQRELPLRSGASPAPVVDWRGVHD